MKFIRGLCGWWSGGNVSEFKIKFRGKLKFSEPFVYEAAQKQHLYSHLDKSLAEI